MFRKTIGFVGGGRVTRIFLESFKKSGIPLEGIVVSDTSPDVLAKLQNLFPEVITVLNGNKEAIAREIVFIALHPPAIADTLTVLGSYIIPDAMIVSLAPKLTIEKMTSLAKTSKVARMIPNAPSIIGKGFNPVAFSTAINEADKKVLDELFVTLGEYKSVPEQNLEAYAILTAMGCTYLWFQLYELQNIVQGFGLSKEETEEGIRNMVAGALATMFDSGLAPGDVMDLVPVKPLGDQEEAIKAIYREKLNPIYQRIKP